MRIKQFIYLLTAALVLGACSEELSTGQSASGETVTVSLSLQASEMQQVNLTGSSSSSSVQATRSVTALADADEEVIDNLWVFEYADGAYVRGQYLSQVDVDKLTLDLSTASSANIYFVANVGEAAYKGKTLATETAFKNYNLSITDEASITPSAGYLPMFKVVKAVTIPDYFESGATVTLDYMVSRVDLTYTVTSNMSSNFVLKQSRLINVPRYLYPYIDPDIASGTNFPTDTLTTQNFAREDLADATTGTLTFYLPDNRRGVGSNTAATDAKLKAGIENATAVQLIGYKDGDEVTYNLYLGGDEFNDYNLERNTKYTLTADLDGTSTGDLRVTQSQTSNTYIIEPGGTLYIPVKRANQSDLGEQLADVSTGWTPGILWRDNSSLTISATDIGNGVMEVTASSTTATGNALVYITDGTNILWSWQIWVTSYDPDSENETYNGYTFMDRNLGAASDVAGTANALGLLYQWGRKDPLARSSATTADNTTLQTFYSGGSGSTAYTKGNTTAPTTSANNLKNSVRNPGVFYYNASTPNDWYCGSSTTQNGVLWGTTKTVYDPCPSGWKVAPLAAFSTWSTSTSTWNSTNLGRTFTAASGSWYPATGFRVQSSGALSGVGATGYYWSSAISTINASDLAFNSSAVYPATTGNRSNGCAVRCVQE